MANAKHSPAPWTSHPIERRQGLPYVPVAAETLIARVYSKHFGDDEQASANGRLVAAAPELLEALCAIVDRDFTYMSNEVKGFSGAITQAQINAARRAVAKATGSAT